MRGSMNFIMIIQELMLDEFVEVVIENAGSISVI